MILFFCCSAVLQILSGTFLIFNTKENYLAAWPKKISKFILRIIKILTTNQTFENVQRMIKLFLKHQL